MAEGQLGCSAETLDKISDLDHEGGLVGTNLLPNFLKQLWQNVHGDLAVTLDLPDVPRFLGPHPIHIVVLETIKVNVTKNDK